MKLILASASPRRAEILRNFGVDFEIVPSNAPEIVDENTPCDKISEELARLKARDIFEKHPDRTVLGADTTVILGNTVLGKPKNDGDAFNMLTLLSGKTHHVCTGVCIISDGREISFTEKTGVTFFELTPEEIRDYIATGEPADKAGAYGIQGLGGLFVKEIHGDYLTVVGLPGARCVRILRQLTTETDSE